MIEPTSQVSGRKSLGEREGPMTYRQCQAFDISQNSNNSDNNFPTTAASLGRYGLREGSKGGSHLDLRFLISNKSGTHRDYRNLNHWYIRYSMVVLDVVSIFCAVLCKQDGLPTSAAESYLGRPIFKNLAR